MKLKAVSGVMLTLLLIGVLALSLNFELVNADPQTYVWLHPMHSTVSIGESFTIDVNVTDVDPLHTYEFKLGFDPSILNPTTVTPGPINPPGAILGPIDPITHEWTPLQNASDGFVWVMADISVSGFSGSAVMMTINFTALKLGNSTLDLYDTELVNHLGQDIGHIVWNGSVKAIGPVGGIYIRADGSVSPDTAPISTVDNVTYTLTDNIFGNVSSGLSAIVIERDNIVFDGAGYTLQGLEQKGIGIHASGINNVTIKNIRLKAFGIGIKLEDSSDNTISGNNITNNGAAIGFINVFDSTISGNNITNNEDGILLGNSSNNIICENIIRGNLTQFSGGISLMQCMQNTISRNNITNNGGGIYLLMGASNNTIYHNNFIDNMLQVSISVTGLPNVWDDGYPSGGNYWSDHEERYPNATEIDDSGVWDTPYVIDDYNQDDYPLMNPYVPLLGDLNDDRTINILDVIVLAGSFGSELGDPNWNPDADLNDDGIINIFDAILIAGNFGKTS